MYGHLWRGGKVVWASENSLSPSLPPNEEHKSHSQPKCETHSDRREGSKPHKNDLGIMTRVRNSNLGLCFFPFKCCVSQLSVDRFGKNFEGVMLLGQAESSPNFSSFGPQRAEKSNI